MELCGACLLTTQHPHECMLAACLATTELCHSLAEKTGSEPNLVLNVCVRVCLVVYPAVIMYAAFFSLSVIYLSNYIKLLFGF